MKDPIEQAIGATEPTVVMRQITVTISSSGRPCMVAIPTDMTEAELFEVVGWMSNQLRVTLQQEAAKRRGPQLVVARGLPPPA